MKRGDGAFGHALARRRATSSSDLRLLAPAVVAWVVAAATLAMPVAGHLWVAAAAIGVAAVASAVSAVSGVSAARFMLRWLVVLTMVLVVILQLAAAGHSVLRVRGGVQELVDQRAVVTALVVITGDPLTLPSRGNTPRVLREATVVHLDARGRQRAAGAPVLLASAVVVLVPGTLVVLASPVLVLVLVAGGSIVDAPVVGTASLVLASLELLVLVLASLVLELAAPVLLPVGGSAAGGVQAASSRPIRRRRFTLADLSSEPPRRGAGVAPSISGARSRRPRGRRRGWRTPRACARC